MYTYIYIYSKLNLADSGGFGQINELMKLRPMLRVGKENVHSMSWTFLVTPNGSCVLVFVVVCGRQSAGYILWMEERALKGNRME